MDFDKAVAELEALVATLERDGDERALLLLQLVDAIHRPAIARLAAGDRDHPLVQSVLAMYELADLDDALLVEEALDEVRPYIESHGGAVELIEVADGTVHVRMSGACHGCAASAMTLRRGIEEVLRERYPGFREVVAHAPEGEQVAAAPELLQIENVGSSGNDAPAPRVPRFESLDADGLEPGELRAFEVEGVALAVANVDGGIYAFRDACPVDGLPISGGRLADTVLVCPWHNCAFDARSGRRADGEPGDGLAVVPIAQEGQSVKVAVNVL